jgi:hypothetical protein
VSPGYRSLTGRFSLLALTKVTIAGTLGTAPLVMVTTAPAGLVEMIEDRRAG